MGFSVNGSGDVTVMIPIVMNQVNRDASAVQQPAVDPLGEMAACRPCVCCGA